MNLTKEQQQAYDWAIKQSYPSVAATYAKILAGVITQLEDELRELARMHSKEYGNLKIANANAKVTRMMNEVTRLKAEIERLRKLGWKALEELDHLAQGNILDDFKDEFEQALGGE